jgi:hypothetical protein
VARDLKVGDRLDRALPCRVRVVEGAERTLTFVASTEVVAWDGDVVRASAWEDGLDLYRTNPVVLWCHNAWDLPIGRSTEQRVVLDDDEPRLEMDVEFCPEDVNEIGPKAYRAYLSGFLRAVSVGFVVKAWEKPSDEDRASMGLGPWGVVITESQLLELSCCAVGADPKALLKDGSVPRSVKDDLLSIRRALTESDRIDLDKVLRGVEGQTSLDDLMTELQGLRGELRAGKAVRASRPSRRLATRSVGVVRSGGDLYDDLMSDVGTVIDDVD